MFICFPTDPTVFFPSPRTWVVKGAIVAFSAKCTWRLHQTVADLHNFKLFAVLKSGRDSLNASVPELCSGYEARCKSNLICLPITAYVSTDIGAETKLCQFIWSVAVCAFFVFVFTSFLAWARDFFALIGRQTRRFLLKCPRRVLPVYVSRYTSCWRRSVQESIWQFVVWFDTQVSCLQAFKEGWLVEVLQYRLVSVFNCGR